MAMTAAQYAALLLTDAEEGAAWDLAQGRYLYAKGQFAELDAQGVAELVLTMAMEKVAAGFTPESVEFDGYLAGADLSAKQYRFVQMEALGVVTALTAGQRGIVGVLQNAPASGEECLIAGVGVTPIKTGTAITLGASVMSDSAGLAITAAASAANHVWGYALEAASGAGVQINILFGYQGPVTNNS